MNALNKMPLLLTLALGLSVGCGSDSKDDNGNDDAGSAGDAGGKSDAGGDSGPAAGCKGLYEGIALAKMQSSVATTGACIAAAQVEEICTTDPITASATAGKSCYLNGRRDAALATCTIEGEGTGTNALPGLRATSPTLSEACLTCYADAVVCSSKNCLEPCVANPAGKDCSDCRERDIAGQPGCNPVFYTCSGLPRPENIK